MATWTHVAKLSAADRRKVNTLLADVCKGMADAIPLADMQTALDSIGARFEQDFILCGREGRATLDLFRNGTELESMLVLTWHKFDTGRYETVAYVS